MARIEVVWAPLWSNKAQEPLGRDLTIPARQVCHIRYIRAQGGAPGVLDVFAAKHFPANPVANVRVVAESGVFRTGYELSERSCFSFGIGSDADFELTGNPLSCRAAAMMRDALKARFQPRHGPVGVSAGRRPRRAVGNMTVENQTGAITGYGYEDHRHS